MSTRRSVRAGDFNYARVAAEMEALREHCRDRGWLMPAGDSLGSGAAPERFGRVPDMGNQPVTYWYECSCGFAGGQPFHLSEPMRGYCPKCMKLLEIQLNELDPSVR